eukprot:scaffold129793_cov20-Prasinocladus_malaysianus.AAC.1
MTLAHVYGTCARAGARQIDVVRDMPAACCTVLRSTRREIGPLRGPKLRAECSVHHEEGGRARNAGRPSVFYVLVRVWPAGCSTSTSTSIDDARVSGEMTGILARGGTTVPSRGVAGTTVDDV